MDVAVYHPWLKEKGGAEKVVLEYARRSSHEVTVYTLYIDEEDTFQGFEDVEVGVLGSNKKPGGLIDKALRFGLGSLTSEIPMDEHDALLVSEAGLGCLITLRNSEKPAICYCHTPLRAAHPDFKETYRKEMSLWKKPVLGIGARIYSFLEKRAWGKFDKVYSNSELTKDRIERKGLAEDVEVLNPGVDTEGNQPGDYENYFLYPTRFRRYKRQELAIQAFEEADIEDFELVLAGSAQEEDYIEELKEKAGENVRFEGDVPGDRWKELYRNCYTVLFCAREEDWGIIPVEAASFGKPVISVDEGGPRESVIDGETGFLVEAEPSKFAEKMKYLVENPDKVREMGKKGREESKKYSWEKFVDRLDGGLEEVKKV